MKQRLSKAERELRDVLWPTEPPRGVSIAMDEIGRFDARGMRRVYSRCDSWPNRAALNMDVWDDRAGRLFVRFWSRSDGVDDRSLVVSGYPPNMIPEDVFSASELWIAAALRDEYADWITSEW